MSRVWSVAATRRLQRGRNRLVNAGNVHGTYR